MKLVKYESKWTNQIIDLWNDIFKEYPITKQQLVHNLISDENFDSNYFRLLVHDYSLLGFCIGIKRKYPFWEKGIEEGKGWIISLVVSSKYQHQGYGAMLLNDVERRLKCSKIVLASYSPYYFFPGVVTDWVEANTFFYKHGYRKKEKAIRMEMSLNSYSYPIEILEKKKLCELDGFKFSTFKWDDSYDLLKFLEENFSVGWRYHVVQAIRRGNAEDTIILCKKDEEIVGYVQRNIDGDETRYGPFGVKSSTRNRGIGSVLAHEMWNTMKIKKLEKVWFHSTDENGCRFYKRNGMHIKSVLYHYEKEKIKG